MKPSLTVLFDLTQRSPTRISKRRNCLLLKHLQSRQLCSSRPQEICSCQLPLYRSLSPFLVPDHPQEALNLSAGQSRNCMTSNGLRISSAKTFQNLSAQVARKTKS